MPLFSDRDLFLPLVLGLCVASACQSKQETPRPRAKPAAPAPPEPVADDPAAEARILFKVRCATCHGAEGRGDGPGGAVLTLKPRNFTDSVWQDGVKDEQLREIIVKGGAAVGKSPGMAPNPDLEKEPEVMSELVKIIRGLKL
jgi:mono/diheme cytochrome c family protein